MRGVTCAMRSIHSTVGSAAMPPGSSWWSSLRRSRWSLRSAGPRPSSGPTGSPSPSCSRSSRSPTSSGPTGRSTRARSSRWRRSSRPSSSCRRSLTVLLIALAVIPEWVRRRTDWYILVFNACNLVAPALLARAVFDAVGESTSAGWTVGAALAILAFLLLHYGLLATVLHLARGVQAADTIRLDCVLIDAGLLSLGRDRRGALGRLSRAGGADAPPARARLPLARDPGARRGDRASSRRPGSTTSATSRPRSARSSGAPRASTGRSPCS